MSGVRKRERREGHLPRPAACRSNRARRDASRCLKLIRKQRPGTRPLHDEERRRDVAEVQPAALPGHAGHDVAAPAVQPSMEHAQLGLFGVHDSEAGGSAEETGASVTLALMHQ